MKSRIKQHLKHKKKKRKIDEGLEISKSDLYLRMTAKLNYVKKQAEEALDLGIENTIRIKGLAKALEELKLCINKQPDQRRSV